MNVDLTGKVAIVTGGSRGIGRAIAGDLAAVGAKVAILGRDEAKAVAAAGEIGKGARGYRCDVSIAGPGRSLVTANFTTEKIARPVPCDQCRFDIAFVCASPGYAPGGGAGLCKENRHPGPATPFGRGPRP